MAHQTYTEQQKKEMVSVYRELGNKTFRERYPKTPISTVYVWHKGGKVGKNKPKQQSQPLLMPTNTKAKEPSYEAIHTPAPAPKLEPRKEEKPKSKIIMICSEDADSIINVLKGML